MQHSWRKVCVVRPVSKNRCKQTKDFLGGRKLGFYCQNLYNRRWKRAEGFFLGSIRSRLGNTQGLQILGSQGAPYICPGYFTNEKVRYWTRHARHIDNLADVYSLPQAYLYLERRDTEYASGSLASVLDYKGIRLPISQIYAIIMIGLVWVNGERKRWIKYIESALAFTNWRLIRISRTTLKLNQITFGISWQRYVSPWLAVLIRANK